MSKKFLASPFSGTKEHGLGFVVFVLALLKCLTPASSMPVQNSRESCAMRGRVKYARALDFHPS
jgi:hypothetical protein